MQPLRSLPIRLQQMPWRRAAIPNRTLSTPFTAAFKPQKFSSTVLQASSRALSPTPIGWKQPLTTTTKATSLSPWLQTSHFTTSSSPNEGEDQEIRGRHVLDCLVQDEPGVLSTVAPVLSNKGFNIESLAIGKSEFADVSRMTVMLKAGEAIPDDEVGMALSEVLEDVRDLPSVWTAEIYGETNQAIVADELLLVEVSVLGPEVVKKLHKGLEELGDLEPLERESRINELSAGLSEVPKENLQENLQSLTRLTERFGGKILDTNINTCVAEV